MIVIDIIFENFPILTPYNRKAESYVQNARRVPSNDHPVYQDRGHRYIIS
jgi:hypothetical protein